MKISLIIDADSVDDFVAAIEAINTRPINVRPFTTAAVIKELEGGQKPKPEKPEEDKPQPKPTEPEPVVADEPSQGVDVQEAPKEAKKPRGRKKGEGTRSPPPAEVLAVAPAAGTKPTSSNGGSIEDLRKRLMQTFADYVQRYGTNYGYTDVSKMLTDTFGPGVRKSSDVTDDNLAKAVAVVGQAIEANPFGRRRADVQ